MPSSRTPWKKSRTLGDVYGGRSRKKLTDNIFHRLHSLTPPGPHDEVPIVIQDNPSRDFVFPTTREALTEQVRRLPAADTHGITHLWLRRVNQRQFDAGVPQAEFICGSGVRLIVIYPWPADLLQRFGVRKPTDTILRQYAPWTTDLRRDDGQWCLAWNPDVLERYCLDHLLIHEIGHHLDWYRNGWTAANRRETEDRAASYAARWLADGVQRLSPAS